MKKLILVLAAFLFMLPNVIVANPAAQRAATTLTNRVMRMLEPRIAEIADRAPVPPAAKDEMTRQLNEAARQIVNREIQNAAGGRLPRPPVIVNKVVDELNTIAQNIVLGILDGSLAGGEDGGGAVIMSSAKRATPPPLEQRPYLAIYVFGHNDSTVNNFLSNDITRALVRSEYYREAPRYEEFLLIAENQQPAESGIVELAREHDIQQVGILSMRSILGTYIITAKIVNVGNGETIAESELDNSLASLADIRAASEGLVERIIVEIERYISSRTGTVTTSPVQRATTVEPIVIEFDAAPNPVNHGSSVLFSINTENVTSWMLDIVDSRGRRIKKISATTPTVRWHLDNRRGRTVETGRYEVRGTVTLADGRREEVSAFIDVR